MTYATYFLPGGMLAVGLMTTREGGPFVVEYAPGIGAKRRNANAVQILWSYVRDHAPSVYREAVQNGWTTDGTSKEGNG